MGEQKEAAKHDCKKKAAADAGAKKNGSVVTVVLKLDLHCDDCDGKVRRFLNHFEGVQSVKTDRGANTVTVTGKVDPAKLKEGLEGKMKKKVELVSPGVPKPKEITVVLKIGLQHHGCSREIEKIIKKIKGVAEVTVDKDKDLVTVKGTMDVKELVRYLEDEQEQKFEVVLTK